jgi:hypothetical protein
MFTRKVVIEELVPAWEECDCKHPHFKGKCVNCQGSGGKWHEAVGEFEIVNLLGEKVIVRSIEIPYMGGDRVTKSSILVREYTCVDIKMYHDEVKELVVGFEPCPFCTAGDWSVLCG